MLRKRNSVSAVRKFVAAVLSALALVVLCVSCGADTGEYLGKAGTKERCHAMADDAGCGGINGNDGWVNYKLIGTECFCNW